jgi:hypothetical protein
LKHSRLALGEIDVSNAKGSFRADLRGESGFGGRGSAGAVVHDAHGSEDDILLAGALIASDGVAKRGPRARYGLIAPPESSSQRLRQLKRTQGRQCALPPPQILTTLRRQSEEVRRREGGAGKGSPRCGRSHSLPGPIPGAACVRCFSQI